MAEEVPAVRRDQQDSLTDEELEASRKFAVVLGVKTGLSIITHPLSFAKTLFQLGYEPYPLSVGKAYLIAGRNVYYLPNVLQYLRYIRQDFGTKVLYSGLEAGIVSSVIGSSVSFAANLYMNRYFPDVGGAPINLNKSEAEMTNAESARVKVRQAIRDTISHTFSVVISRPFTVIMVREIAQLVGGENKYHGLFSSIYRIGDEEGISGFFAGLVPSLLADYVTIWGATTLRYVAERVLEHVRKEKKETADDADNFTEFRRILDYGLPLLVGSLSYPFQVVSTVMAVGGSGLAVSLLPYSPSFSHWEESYIYLKPHGLTRGGRIFLREQKGAISVGKDHRLYASNKHFI